MVDREQVTEKRGSTRTQAFFDSCVPMNDGPVARGHTHPAERASALGGQPFLRFFERGDGHFARNGGIAGEEFFQRVTAFEGIDPVYQIRTGLVEADRHRQGVDSVFKLAFNI